MRTIKDLILENAQDYSNMPLRLSKFLRSKNYKANDWQESSDDLLDTHVSIGDYYNDNNKYNMNDSRHYEKHYGTGADGTAGDYNKYHKDGILYVWNKLSNKQKKDWFENSFIF